MFAIVVLFQSAVTSSMYEEAGLSVQEKDSKSRPNLFKHNRTRITSGPRTAVRFLGVLGLKTTLDEKTQNIKVVALEISKNFHVECFSIWSHFEWVLSQFLTQVGEKRESEKFSRISSAKSDVRRHSDV